MSRSREALAVTRLIHEVLVNQLSIPLRQIVNDTTFRDYTGSRRPDLLISEFEYDGENDRQFIKNLVAYAEVKDGAAKDSRDWRDAWEQGKGKSGELNLPYFIVTNCRASVFYNASTLQELSLNRNPIREFQTIDILRLIKNQLNKNPSLSNIQTNVDSISTISEAVFNKKLWELATIYRGINFKNNQQKIDFTIGFVALEYYEEKAILENQKDSSKIYWSECWDDLDEKLVGNINSYIARLEKETTFKDFRSLISTARKGLSQGKQTLVSGENCRRIYKVIDSMRPLHGTGFDLFGAVYEMFAAKKEKQDFGEYFTRRHYAHLFSKLLLKEEGYWNPDREFTILDPACGTGGFLTESYKVLRSAYDPQESAQALEFLKSRCLFGIDVRGDNISRTKLNMFLVGDGHTNMEAANALIPTDHPFRTKEFDYIITNPPYGVGTIQADTASVSSVRTELAFLCRIRSLLKIGGRGCVIQPDGVLENPTLARFREEMLRTLDITAIVSLPKFAFAPYTKEKTYAVFFTKRSTHLSRIQRCPVWMYIIDNDGLANSDKRYPTKLRNNRNGWMHDEISGWVSVDGEEMPGLLEDRWMEFDDSQKPTKWLSETGKELRMRKGGYVSIDTISRDKFLTLLPEHYLRPCKYVFQQGSPEYNAFQGRDVPVSRLFVITGGNSGLTEEYLYSFLLHDAEKKYRLLTGSVDLANTARIHRCPLPKNPNKKIKVVEGECVHIIRKGKAGHINYLPDGRYTMTDDAYLLTRKHGSGLQISLEWVAQTQAHLFQDFASKSDNGTWNKSGFLKYGKMDVPSYDEQLDVIARRTSHA